MWYISTPQRLEPSGAVTDLKGVDMSSLPETKVCTKCREEKPTSEFYAATKGGFRYLCKLCYREINNAKRRANPEKHRAVNLKYYYDNKDELNQLRRDVLWPKYYEENKGARQDYRQNRRAAHLSEVKAREREAARRRRARKLDNGFEFYTEEDIFDRWGTDCHICGEPVDLEAPRAAGVVGWELGLHLDHVVPLVAGGSDTIENVKPAHGLCNLKKSKSI